MSESLGPLTYGKRREQIFLGREIAQHRDHSEATAVEIDREVRKIVIGCCDRTHQILEEQAAALTRVAEALLEHELLDAEQIAALVKGEPLPMRPERSTDSREQLEAAREETGDSTKHAARTGDGLRMLPQPGRQPAR
jgi:cell division protease FtsH